MLLISLTTKYTIVLLTTTSAGIGFAPNGMAALDQIEPRFRTEYEKVCVGNKPANAQDVFFEGMLLAEGVGESSMHT